MRSAVIVIALGLTGLSLSQPIRAKWVKHDYGFDGPTPKRIAQLTTGDYIVGYDDVFGPPRHAAITCYGPDGGIKWTKTIWTGVAFSGFSLRKLLPQPGGTFFVLGNTSPGTGSLLHKPYVAKVAANGSTEWSRTYDLDPAIEDEGASDLFPGQDGSIYISGGAGVRGFVARLSPSGVLLDKKFLEDPNRAVSAGIILQDQTGRLQVSTYADGFQSRSAAGIWTLGPDLATQGNDWYPQSDFGDVVMLPGGDVVTAGIHIDGLGYFAGSYIERRRPDRTARWRKRFIDRQGFRDLRIDSAGRIVAHTASLNTDVLRFDDSGNLLSAVDISIPNFGSFSEQFLIDKYGRHYVVSGAFNAGLEEILLGVVRGDRWTGRQWSYVRTFTVGEGYLPHGATLNDATGEICIASTGYNPSIVCLQQAPEALADTYTLPAGVVSNPSRSVLYNDRFAGDAVAVVEAGPTHGSFTLGSDGRFTYAPNGGFSGVDTFTYRASKPGLIAPLATVTLNIQ